MNIRRRKLILSTGLSLLPAAILPRTALTADSGEGGQAFHTKADSDSGRSRTAFR
jgi:hypothetical protein